MNIEKIRLIYHKKKFRKSMAKFVNHNDFDNEKEKDRNYQSFLFPYALNVENPLKTL